jgi:hypothetical protein
LQGFGVRKENRMKRRDFLRIFLLGGLFSLFGKKARAEKKPEKPLKEAMFWKRLD